MNYEFVRLKLKISNICICSFVLFLFVYQSVSAQFNTLFQPKDSAERYISVQMHLFAPYVPFIAKYADERAEQFLVRMVLNDFSMSYDQVTVNIKLETNDIIWKNYTQVFSFSGKQILELNGADFVPFFASLNTPQNISKLGMLHLPPNTDPYSIPEGFYRIALEISSFGKKMRPTKVYTPYYPFFLDHPPKLQVPKNKTVVAQNQAQNIHFEWKPQHLHSENIDAHVKVTYHLELFELITDKDVSTSLPDWTCSTIDNSYALTVNDYPLQLGTKYAWRVRVTTDQSDETYFHNDGCSEMAVFEYQ